MAIQYIDSQIYKPKKSIQYIDSQTHVPQVQGIMPSIVGGAASGIINQYLRPLQESIFKSMHGLPPATALTPQQMQTLAQTPAAGRRQLSTQMLRKDMPQVMPKAQPITQYPKTAELAGAVAPAALMPELREGRAVAGAVGEGAKAIEGAAPSVAKTLANIGLTTGAYSAIPEMSHPTKAAERFGLGGLLGAATGGVLMKGLPGIGAATGKAIKSIPALKEATQNRIAETTDNLLNKWRGNASSENVDKQVFDKMARHYDELSGNAKDLYGNQITEGTAQHVAPSNSFNARYDAIRNQVPNLKINRTGYDQSVNKVIGNLNKQTEQFEGTKFLGKDKQDLQDLASDFKKSKIRNFNDIDNLKQEINDRIMQATPQERKVLFPVKDAIKQIIPDSLEKQGADIKTQWSQVDKDYKNQIIPFRNLPGQKTLSPFMKAYYSGGENTDNLVSKYLQSGKTKEFANRTNNFLKLAPDDETKNLALYAKFKDTEGNPAAFMNRYNSFSDAQKTALFGEDKEGLDNLANAQKKRPALFKPSDKVGVGTRVKRYGKELATAGAGALAAPHIPIPHLAAASTIPILGDIGSSALMKLSPVKEAAIRMMLKGEKGGTPQLPEGNSLLKYLSNILSRSAMTPSMRGK